MSWRRTKTIIRSGKRSQKIFLCTVFQFSCRCSLYCKDGSIYTGCNIENAAFTPTNCAERTAVFKAVSEGKKDFLAIAVVGDREEPLTPCGVCRQVLTEFVDGSTFEVIMEDGAGGIKVMKLEELFPGIFFAKRSAIINCSTI